MNWSFISGLFNQNVPVGIMFFGIMALFIWTMATMKNDIKHLKENLVKDIKESLGKDIAHIKENLSNHITDTNKKIEKNTDKLDNKIEKNTDDLRAGQKENRDKLEDLLKAVLTNQVNQNNMENKLDKLLDKKSG